MLEEEKAKKRRRIDNGAEDGPDDAGTSMNETFGSLRTRLDVQGGAESNPIDELEAAANQLKKLVPGSYKPISDTVSILMPQNINTRLHTQCRAYDES